MVLRGLERHGLSLRAALARFPPSRLPRRILSTRSRSTPRSTIRCGPSMRRIGSSRGRRESLVLSLPQSSGRNSRTKGKPTGEDEKAVRAGIRRSARARGRLGAVLLQFPFRFTTPENLARLKRLSIRFRDYPLVVEVRHSSWSRKDFYDFLHGHGVGFCNIDQPVIGRSIEPSEECYIKNRDTFGFHGRRYDTWFSDDPDGSKSRKRCGTSAALKPARSSKALRASLGRPAAARAGRAAFVA
jgi:hypothetical protein